MPFVFFFFFFFQAEDGIRDLTVTGVQTCALPISRLDVGSPRCRPLETSVDGLTDQIGFRDAVPAGAFLEQTGLAGLDVNLLARHSWHTRPSALCHTSEPTSGDPAAIRYCTPAARGALA